jgi:putative phosphonate metabolism protein
MRYAIYFVPEFDTALARFGATWLGRDIESGRAVAQPPVHGFDAGALSALTAEPRRYGFHATLKPPFALAQGRNEAQLLDAVAHLACMETVFTLPSLRLAAISRFLALVPAAPCPRINALADSCVAALDDFRAPPSEGELTRRRAADLTAAQDALLVRWGYPYVFDEYRFHMTLTNSLEAAARERLMPVLNALADPVANRPVPVTSLSVVVEPSPGCDFVLLARVPLRTPR